MVELADSCELITHSIHPYTRSLDLRHPGGRPHYGSPVQAYRAAGRCPSP